MCGGVIFPYREEYRDALTQHYSLAEVEAFRKGGQVRSLYWQRAEPLLPVWVDGDEDEPARLELLLWGNRDKNVPFPQTGWARVDSIEAGKWSYLRPQPVLIPVTYGVEKNRWFEIEHGVKGVVARRGDLRRVYMLTDEAAPEFLAHTGHGRMPMLQDQQAFPWLPGDPSAGTDYAQQRSFT